MPLFEYRCTQCDHLFDKFQSWDDDPPDCSTCGGEVIRIISSPSLRFKGSGFHSTDYGKRGPKNSMNARGN